MRYSNSNSRPPDSGIQASTFLPQTLLLLSQTKISKYQPSSFGPSYLPPTHLFPFYPGGLCTAPLVLTSVSEALDPPPKVIPAPAPVPPPSSRACGFSRTAARCVQKAESWAGLLS